MRVAITGVSGYLGRLLAERLVAEGFGAEDLVGIDVLGSHLPPSRLTYVRRDVRSERIAEDLAGCDVVVHMAAVVDTSRDAQLAREVNVGGTRNVLAACERAGVKRVVLASSVAAYGVQGDEEITEDTPLLAGSESVYGETKRLAEQELDLFEERNPKVQVARVRPAVVAGPSCPPWVRDALRAVSHVDVVQGLRLPVVHEQDVARAFHRAVVEPATGAFLVAHREPLTGPDLAALTGGTRIVLTERILTLLMAGANALGLAPPGRDFVLLAARNRYRCDPSRTERELGLELEHGPAEAVRGALGMTPPAAGTPGSSSTGQEATT